MEQFKKKKLGLMPLEKRLMLDASLPALIGQVLWLDAADTSTILDAEGDNAASGAAFSGQVNTWVDKSASGYNVTAAAAGERPAYGTNTLGGRGVVTFDGTTDRLTNGAASITGTDVTMFVVFNRTTAAGRDAVFELGSGGSRNAIFVNDASAPNQINFYANSGFSPLAGAYTAGTYAMVSAIYDGTAIQGWRNANSVLSGTTFARAATTGIAIGDDSTSGDQLQGNIAEIIVYDRHLTAEERHDVETYLAGKWGLTISDVAPTVDTNNTLTLNQGTGATVSSLYLGSSDLDNDDTRLIYTITDLADYGTITNLNTGLVLGLGDTFTQADISSNYIRYTHNGSPNFSDSFSFTVSDQYLSTANTTFNFSMLPANVAPVIDGWTLVSSEDFQSGATGWSDNTTETSNPYLTRFLGRHSMEGGAQNTYKTYALSGTQDYAVVTFDFYEIDSWDGESFRIYIDDVLVYNVAFTQGAFNSPADGSSGIVSWQIQESTPFNTNFAYGTWTDQAYHFTMIVDTSLASLKLGFSSTLDQAVSDEAWGVDNINIYEVSNTGTPGPMSVVENTGNGNVVGTVTAKDANLLDTLTYSITGGTGAGVFSINASTGQIIVANAALLNYELATSYTLTVMVEDNGSPILSDTETFTINIIDMPENTAPSIPATGPFTVAENAANNTVVGTVTGTDPESNTLTYSITAGNGAGVFAINSATGAIRILSNTNLNYETTPSYTLTIQATDNGFGNLTATRNVTINVTNVNEAPSFDPVQAVLNSDSTIRYNAATGNFYRYVTSTATQAVATTAAGAAMLNGQAGHLVVITSAAENTFVRNMITAMAWMGASDTAVEGQWRWLGGPDAGQLFWSGAAAGSAQNGYYTNWGAGEPNDSGGVQDGGVILTSGLWDDTNVATAAAYVIEWEGTAVLASLQNGPYSVAENVVIGTSVGFAHSSDPDLGDTRTYSVTGGTGTSLFAVNSTTGEITTTAAINYEAGTSYTLNLRVQDVGGLFDTVTVTINITDLNETPTLNPAGPFAFNENVAPGTSVTTMASSDPDTGQTLTYSIQSGNTGGMFAINAATGEITFAGSPDYETVNSYSLVIRVTDNGTGSLYAEQTVAVTINNLNEAPVLNAAGPFAFNENVAIGTAVTTMTATEQDTGQTLTYSIQSGNTGGMFAINATTGAITFAASPNYEVLNSYSLVIRVTDNGAGALYTEQTVAITINDVNETPVLNPAGPFTFAENVAPGTAVTTMSSSDPDNGQTRTYSIQSGNTNGTFAINATTGAITFAASPNYEQTSVYNLVIRVTDNGTGPLFAQQTVVINITNVNESPVFDSVQQVLASDPTLRYNATTGNFYRYITGGVNLAAARTAAGAAMLDGQAGHLVTITSAAENAFINGFITNSIWLDGSDAAVEGEWRWMSGPEAGQMFWLGTAAGSAQGGFYTNWNGGEPNNSANEDGVQMLVSGRWNDINVGGGYGYVIEWEGAAILAARANGPYTVVENTAPGTSVGFAHSNDPDLGDTRTYSITGGTGTSLFSINATTGEIIQTGAINYEAGSSYTLNLRVQDAGGLFDTVTVTINITDVNETPVLNPAGPFTFAENIAPGTVVTTMSATDQDTGQTLTYSIQGGNTNGLFAINASTGVLTFAGSPNYELQNLYNLVIRVTDNGTGALFAQQTVTVNITNLNEAPVFDPVQQVLASDPTLRYNATTGNFYRYVAAGGNLATAQAAAAAALLDGQAGHLVTITSAAENAFIASLITTNTWIGGSDAGVEGEWRWMSGPEAGQMFWLGNSAGSPQGGFYNNWNGGEPNDSGGNEDGIQMYLGGAWNDTNIGGGNAYVIEWEGAAILAARANGPYTVVENTAPGTSVGFAHSNDPDLGDTRTYSITGGTGTSLFSINATTGEIIQTGAINYEAGSSYTLDLRVQDAGGLFDTVTVTINITDVNEVPVLNPAGPFAFDENIAPGTTVTTMSASDQDGGQTLTYSIQSGNTGGMFAINSATGEITFVGSPDYETVSAYNLVVRVTDNGTGALYAEQTVVIAINDLNEVPVLSAAGPFTFTENVPIGTAVTTMTAVEQDAGQTLTYTIQSGNTGGMFAINAATGALTFAGSPNYEALALYNLVIRVTDNGTGNLYSEQTVTVNITDINDVPDQINISYDHITENSAIGTLIGTLSTIDQDPTDTHTYSLITNPGSKFIIVGDELRSDGPIDYELNQTFSVTIRTDDGNGGQLDRIFTIFVDDQADTFTPPPATPTPNPGTPPTAVIEDEIRTASLVRASLNGGEFGQMMAFYGMGDFHQIVRENVTAEVLELSQKSFDDASEFDPEHIEESEGDGSAAADQTVRHDRFTNLRQALQFFEDLKNIQDPADAEEQAEAKLEQEKAAAARNLPVNTIDQQFVDVLTYHEQRQARLREALKNA